MSKPKASILRGLFIDALILAGLASLFYGLYQVSPPKAFQVTGWILLALGLALNIRGRD